MERLAMVESLRRFFPRDLGGNPVHYLPPRKVNCITANPLLLDSRSASSLALMARSMVAEIEEGSEHERQDNDQSHDAQEVQNLEHPVGKRALFLGQ